MLSLPVVACQEDTLLLGQFHEWIVNNVELWSDFTKGLGIGVDLEDLILVTGFHRTRSWSNIAFAEVDHEADAQLSLGVEVTGTLGANISWPYTNVFTQGAIRNQDPSGEVCGSKNVHTTGTP